MLRFYPLPLPSLAIKPSKINDNFYFRFVLPFIPAFFFLEKRNTLVDDRLSGIFYQRKRKRKNYCSYSPPTNEIFFPLVSIINNFRAFERTNTKRIDLAISLKHDVSYVNAIALEIIDKTPSGDARENWRSIVDR